MLKTCILSLLILSQICLADLTVRLATYPDYEPFCFYKPNADTSQYFEKIPPNKESELFTGLAWQVVLLSFQQKNYHVELYIVPWPRALEMLQEGSVDAVFPAIKTPKREQQFLYSQQTVYPANSLLLYSRKGIFTEDYLQTLKNVRIGAVRGFSYGQRWSEIVKQNNISVLPMRNLKHGFMMLESGRIDALPGYELSHDYYLSQWGKKHFFDKSEAFDTARSYLMFNVNSRDILKDFDSGRDTLNANGLYKKLLLEWKMTAKEQEN